MDGLPVAGITNGVGVVGVILLVGWLVFTGRLVPKRFYDDIVHDRNEALASSRIKDTQIAEKDEQLRHMGEIGHTVEHFLTAFQQAADEVDKT